MGCKLPLANYHPQGLPFMDDLPSKKKKQPALPSEFCHTPKSIKIQPMSGGVHKLGQFSSILFSDVPWNKPTSYGVPPWLWKPPCFAKLSEALQRSRRAASAGPASTRERPCYLKAERRDRAWVNLVNGQCPHFSHHPTTFGIYMIYIMIYEQSSSRPFRMMFKIPKNRATGYLPTPERLR